MHGKPYLHIRHLLANFDSLGGTVYPELYLVYPTPEAFSYFLGVLCCPAETAETQVGWCRSTSHIVLYWPPFSGLLWIAAFVTGHFLRFCRRLWRGESRGRGKGRKEFCKNVTLHVGRYQSHLYYGVTNNSMRLWCLVQAHCSHSKFNCHRETN